MMNVDRTAFTMSPGNASEVLLPHIDIEPQGGTQSSQSYDANCTLQPDNTPIS